MFEYAWQSWIHVHSAEMGSAELKEMGLSQIKVCLSELSHESNWKREEDIL